MSRKRLTQIFPFLLPIRRWQRKQFFYLKMRLDGNRYAVRLSQQRLPHVVFEASSLMINEHSGFPLEFQYNKVHNLKLAAKAIDGVVIAPGETFSFFRLARYADREIPYKDGLNLVDGKIMSSYGGGLCQMSDLLFWLFLHSPLTVVERHGHAVQALPPAGDGLPCGTDATVSEGWLDLKVRNETSNTFQVVIGFDGRRMYGRVLSQEPVGTEYRVLNSSVDYIRRKGKIIQTAGVCRLETDKQTGQRFRRELYTNECEIAYPLEEDDIPPVEDEKKEESTIWKRKPLL